MNNFKTEICKKIDNSEFELLKAINKIDEKVDTLEAEVEHLKLENQQLKELLKSQDDKSEQFERKVKIKNLFIYGLQEMESESRDELEGNLISAVQQHLNITLIQHEIDNIKRIGNRNIYVQNDKPRPILVTLSTERKRFKNHGGLHKRGFRRETKTP